MVNRFQRGAGGADPRPPSGGTVDGLSGDGEADSSSSAAWVDGSRLRSFLRALGDLGTADRKDDVVVSVFGDSHVAADFFTGALRRALQRAFGNGGRGFVPIGKPYRSFRQDDVATGLSGQWKTVMPRLGGGTTTKASERSDALYGLGLVALESSDGLARAWTEMRASSTRMDLSFAPLADGGTFDVWVDGRHRARVATAPPASGSLRVTFPPGAHTVEVRPRGDGPVRIQGAAFDTDSVGVVVDAFGVNGARAESFLRAEGSHWERLLAQRTPSLVVLAFGTNEADDDTVPAADDERALRSLVERVQRAVPGAACLLVGPPDRAVRAKDGFITPPKLFEVVAAVRRVAKDGGCAFLDQLSLMGGPGAMARWAHEAEPRAQLDYVHFTKKGYALMGERLGALLLQTLREQGYAIQGFAPPKARGRAPITPPPAALPSLPNPQRETLAPPLSEPLDEGLRTRRSRARARQRTDPQ
jgi:lysophospholipase L1-like esterase